MTARDDYPYLAEHSSCDTRMENQVGGSEYTRALNEIDRLRALVALRRRRRRKDDIPCVEPPCPPEEEFEISSDALRRLTGRSGD